MSNRIHIEGLKQIRRMTFEVPTPGAYLLSGHNGVGKSSLLACLLRLGDKNAFPRFFRTSQISAQLDQFDTARIKYVVDADEVTYRYSGKRWVPHPKRHSMLLQRFGFAEVLHIAADAKRIEPRPEDFRPNRLKDAPTAIRRAAEKIFGDPKFQELKTINVRRGVGAEAFLLAEAITPGQRPRYYSERNFSLGELCVVKLLRELDRCPKGALLLIDELELALHPRAQVRLVEHLESIAVDKGLTVILSTHSPTLIRSVPRNRVFFVFVEDGEHKCVRGCYPAFALGQISIQGETTPDLVLYVEDEAARTVVTAIVSLIVRDEFANEPPPTVVVVPVGTFRSVVRFLDRAETMLPSNTRQVAFLDADVRDESLIEYKQSGNFAILEEFKRVEKRLRYLPWTPELGVCRFLATNKQQQEIELQKFFQDGRITMQDIPVETLAILTGKDAREEAKKCVCDLVDQIAGLKGWEAKRALEGVAHFFAKKQLEDANNRSTLLGLFMPVLRG